LRRTSEPIVVESHFDNATPNKMIGTAVTNAGIRLPVPIPAPIFAVAYIALSVLAAQRRVGNVGHEAHIGGAVTGFLLAGVMSPDGFGPVLAGFSRMLHR